MRSSAAPLLALALLAALVFLLPEREGAAPLPELVLDLEPIELVEPPAWVLDEDDPVARDLDRLFWAGHEATERALADLDAAAGTLDEELLGRLARLGPRQAVTVSKLLNALSTPGGEEVLDELVRRAHSESGLVATTALRLLADHPDPRAMAGIYPRLGDADETVRDHARAALARRAARGDAEAVEILLEELEEGSTDPSIAFVMALAAVDEVALAPRIDAILERLRAEGSETAWWTALTVQLARDDPGTEEKVEEILAGEDDIARANALKACLAARAIVGAEHWRHVAETADPGVKATLVELMALALDTADESAPHAAELLETMALGRDPHVYLAAHAAIFARGFPRALEATRAELLRHVGGELSQTVDRIISARRVDRSDYAAIALERLEDPELHPDDELLLLRLLAHVEPALAVDRVVEGALDESPRRAERARQLVQLVPNLGWAGVERLAAELGQPRADVLFVYAASKDRSPEALPYLEQLALAPGVAPAVRVEALDTIARLRDGPRADALRRVVTELGDRQLAARARLLYWNYL